MAYTKLGLKDGDTVKATHVDHIEDGIDELNTDLTGKADSYTISDSSTPLSEYLTVIQDNWSGLPTGVSTLDLNLAQRGGALCFKNNAVSGAVLVFGYSAAANPPKLVRNNSDTWTVYEFSVSTVSTASVGDPVVMGDEESAD